MKYLDEYRDGKLAQKVVNEIRKVQTRPWVIMEVCVGPNPLHREARNRFPAAGGN